VSGANAIFAKFDSARKEKTDFDVKASLKELSFHAGATGSSNRPARPGLLFDKIFVLVSHICLVFPWTPPSFSPGLYSP
jgi:hypothetical protein